MAKKTAKARLKRVLRPRGERLLHRATDLGHALDRLDDAITRGDCREATLAYATAADRHGRFNELVTQKPGAMTKKVKQVWKDLAERYDIGLSRFERSCVCDTKRRGD